MKTALSVTVFMILQALTASASAALNIAPSAEAAKPLQPGQAAPAFRVYNVDGSPYDFDPQKLERPTIIISFRGGWCPYCNLQLQDLRHVVPELKAAGFDILFLSADRPEILYSSLKDENQQLPYLILSDSKLEASSALGIAFKVPDAQLQRMREFGLDLSEASGESHNGLPVPAVFIINRAGTITYTYANPDYTVRLSAAEVRSAALGDNAPAL
jgi:peroxiredoxin